MTEKAHRVEFTLTQEAWDHLEQARGFEPRASFVKRALEDFLASEEPRHSPEALAALKAHWDDSALTEQFVAETAPVEKEPEVDPPGVDRGASPVPSPASSRRAPSVRDTWAR